jgi:hypothetical protein
MQNTNISHFYIHQNSEHLAIIWRVNNFALKLYYINAKTILLIS